MKNLLFILLLFGITVFQTGNVFAGEKYLTVTFNSNLSEKYIRVINLLVKSEIVEKQGDNNYKLKIPDDKNSEEMSRYSEFFSLIPEITKVEPPANQKLFNKSFLSNEKLKAGQEIPGIVLIRFKKEVEIAEIKKLDQRLKTNSEVLVKSLNLFKVKLPDSLSVSEAIKIFNKNKLVEYAEADKVMKIQNKVNSPKNPVLILYFKHETEELAVNLFNIVFNTTLEIQNISTKDITVIERKNNSKGYIFNLPNNINAEIASKTLKICPYLTNIDIYGSPNGGAKITPEIKIQDINNKRNN